MTDLTDGDEVLKQWLANASEDTRLENAGLLVVDRQEPSVTTVPLFSHLSKSSPNEAERITFIVPMKSTGKARPRLIEGATNGRKAGMPKAYKKWCRQFKSWVPREFWEIPVSPVILRVLFIRAMPTKITRSKKKAAETYGTVCMSGPDTDNAIGAVMDVLWHKKDGRNDDVVFSAQSTAVWGNNHRIVVTVQSVEPGYVPLDIAQYDQ